MTPQRLMYALLALPGVRSVALDELDHDSSTFLVEVEGGSYFDIWRAVEAFRPVSVRVHLHVRRAPSWWRARERVFGLFHRVMGKAA